jgi:hypothetical protein
VEVVAGRSGAHEWRTADPLGCAPPDFLLRLMALANFMRFPYEKGAHATVSSAGWQESGSG